MSLDFYDSTGKPYAYTEDNEHIFTFSGKPIAFINDGSIYSFSDLHNGYFENGLIRDSHGNALLFTDDCSGGPMKPVKHVKPVKGVKHVKPVKGVKHVKPVKPVNTLSWSSSTPESIFEP